MQRPDLYPAPVLTANDIIIVHRKSNSALLDNQESAHINIIGEVHTPGRISIRTGETLLDAVARAGGPILETADYRIRLIRIHNNTKLQLVFDMEHFYSDEEGINSDMCSVTLKCKENIPLVQAGDHLFIDRKDEIEISWWLDFVWKAATVGIFVLATWNQVGR